MHPLFAHVTFAETALFVATFAAGIAGGALLLARRWARRAR